MRVATLLSVVGLITLGASLASAEPSHYTGTYYVPTLPGLGEILQIHDDGTIGQTVSDQVTAGAGGFTFSDSYGTWKVIGQRTVFARLLNLNFAVGGAAPTYTGIAVVDYTLYFAPGFDTFTLSCQGKIYPPGQDPFAPTEPPSVEFDCSYFNGHYYRRVPLN